MATVTLTANVHIAWQWRAVVYALLYLSFALASISARSSLWAMERARAVYLRRVRVTLV